MKLKATDNELGREDLATYQVLPEALGLLAETSRVRGRVLVTDHTSQVSPENTQRHLSTRETHCLASTLTNLRRKHIGMSMTSNSSDLLTASFSSLTKCGDKNGHAPGCRDNQTRGQTPSLCGKRTHIHCNLLVTDTCFLIKPTMGPRSV